MPPYRAALRVGLMAEGTETGDAVPALARLASLLPDQGAADRTGPLLRLLSQDTSPAERAIGLAARQAGWTLWRVSGTPVEPRDDTLALDGDPADPAAAKLAAMMAIAGNSDVFFVLGDPLAPALAASIEEATGLGVPVVLLAPGRPERLVQDPGWMVSLDAPLEGPAVWDSLGQRVLAMLRSERAEPPVVPLRPRAIWRTYRAAMDWLWHDKSPVRAPDPPSGYWGEPYCRADALANGYADRYRSSYTLVLALAAAALIAAVLGLFLRHDDPDAAAPSALWTAVPEIVCLGLISAIVLINRRSGWQSRLILWRLMSELCRKQAALSLLGRSLPVSRIARLTEGDELSWVGWRFAAAIRAAPLATGVLAGASLAAARDAAASVLLQGQRSYHAARAEAGEHRERRLVGLGTVAFFVTVACVVIKVALLLAHRDGPAEQFGLVAALLPAAAAAPFGLRAYAELELLVKRSERMIATLDEAAHKLARTDTGRPLASQYIGAVLQETAEAMLGDVEGWVQLSRVKDVEAG